MSTKLGSNFVTNLIIMGAGGHAKVTADIIRALHLDVTGLTDQNPEMLNTVAEPGGAKVILTQDKLLEHLENYQKLPDPISHGVVAIGHNGVRLRLSRQLGHTLAPALVHPAATISPSATLGAGTTVLPRVVVNANASIGLAAILNTGCIIEHDCVLGDGVHISPGATLCGNVTVGDRSWVAAGATVIPGVRIGKDAIIGAGATVIRDVPDGTTVVGSPAKPLSR